MYSKVCPSNILADCMCICVQKMEGQLQPFTMYVLPVDLIITSSNLCAHFTAGMINYIILVHACMLCM